MKSNPVNRRTGEICDQIVKLTASTVKPGFLTKCKKSNTVTRNRESADVFDKQFCAVAHDHRRPIQVAQENRTILQID